jgi:16S rRNA (cytosine1402-N4)-methyltransferase
MRTRRSQSSSDPMPPERHRTVLLHEAVESLALQADDVVVDATLGGAGHAKEIASKLGKEGILIGFDLDPDAIARTQTALERTQPRLHLMQANFRDLANQLDAINVPTITKALFDLGWSSYQLDSGRGFSFLRDEPLLMTYGKEGSALTAAIIVNEWKEESLADIIYGWGEERYSRRIAKRIVEDRVRKPFTTSLQLAEAIKAAVPAAYRKGKLHPATRTFQALRIAVNDELGSLDKGLRGAWYKLAHGGRIAVISFHSIEDRAVKQLFASWEKAGEGKRITKKPLIPSFEEVSENPRARSAKLRVIQKISNDLDYGNSYSKDQQIQALDISG